MSVVDPPESLASTFSFHPTQVSDFCSLRESNGIRQSFLFPHLEYHYTSPDYFYNYEEEEEEEEYDDIIDSHREMSVNKPQKYMDPNNMISDEESDEEREEDGDDIMKSIRKGEGYLQKRVSSRRTLRNSSRVSLIRDDIENCTLLLEIELGLDSRSSLLHSSGTYSSMHSLPKQPDRTEKKDRSIQSPSTNMVSQSQYSQSDYTPVSPIHTHNNPPSHKQPTPPPTPPPPPPTQSLPQSQPPSDISLTVRSNHRNLLAEIHASGVGKD